MREHLTIVAVVTLGLSLLVVPTTARGQSASESPDHDSAQKRADRKASLRMTPGVVCRSIRGYEDYEVLPKAAQTSDEKLLVYLRPLGYQTELVDGAYEAHLVLDFQIRKRGGKAILRQKPKMYEYKPRSEQPPRYVYLKNMISLKDLPPGDYDLTIILHDEIAKGPPASQVVRFRIIPAVDLRKEEKASRTREKSASP